MLSGSQQLRALILLNGSPLEESVLNVVWPRGEGGLSHPRICADGAANLLYEGCNTAVSGNEVLKNESRVRIPTHIVGDLDSIREDVRQHYKALGVDVICRPSENSNDFHKSLKIALEANPGADDTVPIVVAGGLGGRMDQLLGNFNELYCCGQKGLRVYWMSGQNFATVLGAGRHQIHIDLQKAGPICGLIPIGGRVRSVTTTGLKWNVSNQEMAFGVGNLISTSNQVVDASVHIEVSDPILWTLQVDM